MTGNLPKTELFSPGAGKPSLRSALAARSSTDAFGSNVNGDNPNSFDVRGSAGIGFWTDMQLENAGTDCEPSGCEQTDRYTSSVTIDPGAVTTKVSATNSYFPDSGNFGKKYFELWAINHGNYVGNDETGDLPDSSVDYVSSNTALNNDVLTTAVTQWVYAEPYGGYIADGAKTTDATCAAPGDNSCYY